MHADDVTHANANALQLTQLPFMEMNANANAGARTQANAPTHLNNAEFYVPISISLVTEMHMCVPASCDSSIDEEGLGCNLWRSMRLIGDPCGASKGVSQSVTRYELVKSDQSITLGGGAYGNEADVYDPDRMF
ncbi:uncharacterized protein ARMOST_20136 [Armillaria ostoyae]|uniref:Uncharacterized protein n=1 Tax=Armillaria ostoyae TaxID=47428 RepID=A0A284S6I3_ARMOS|nr:uncharacterized protein ARMOST_20136 [Armillaria ostoyae]